MRFAETDAQGVAHNAAYLVWFEVARIDYLARFRGGYPGSASEGDRGADARGRTSATSHAGALRRPAHDPRPLRRVRGARFRFDYSVERDGEQIADGWTTPRLRRRDDHRPTRVPALARRRDQR